ncbi:glycoside hydrolase family 97 protein [Pseudochryseolinea flava]|uniref:Retaining alpha-galactosidase n=1 Tax=Pseudochryseolinea flava TaxID=2059302 RepID=A0A364Y249_9BACT|nr:glycoside hydrolase family 97 protein [Pseudochryseolinea flava]RAW00953.1 Retaining alpha-galactosidase [Pseudochryseolinea flava]
MKKVLLLIFCLISVHMVFAQKAYKINSPDKKIVVNIQTGTDLKWSVTHDGQSIIEPSVIAMDLSKHGIAGKNPKVTAAKETIVNSTIDGLNYKKDKIVDAYTQLALSFKGNYKIVFRAYNDGVAYRFETAIKDSITVNSEEATFAFSDDYKAYIPYVNDPHNKDIYETSFENNYQYINLSKFVKDTLAFAPILVELPNNKKAAITESDLEDYPGMFLQVAGNSFKGKYAPVPLTEKQGGHNNLQAYVMSRATYIAKTKGTRPFPWRVVIISSQDKDLLNNDMVYKLASPSRIADVSWIKPGKVAWDWWNDWNISNVNFKAGINTKTYKYYIDFAAKFGIENILLDEGWATSEDIMKIVPEINLQEIIDYGKQKNVGVWLWGGWLPLDKKTDLALSTYSKMGVKGFKIDFMDRDDQKMVNFYYRFAKKAAEYKLMIDYHGAYKPTGLQRTYPNVLNFEGVRGLENTKWSNTDFPGYDCSIPFIRMLAGPMDYTPGAMKNASKENFRAIFSSPMSQGTRCHQLALYMILESPFEMLADNPTNYIKEPACTKFIAEVPTTFSETIALDGKVSEYAVIARRKDQTWYVGAITNWTPREVTLDFSFLGEGNFEVELFADGLNADREGTDFSRTIMPVKSSDKLTFKLAPGGGLAARVVKK